MDAVMGSLPDVVTVKLTGALSVLTWVAGNMKLMGETLRLEAGSPAAVRGKVNTWPDVESVIEKDAVWIPRFWELNVMS
jgi:hypothetical protein